MNKKGQWCIKFEVHFGIKIKSEMILNNSDKLGMLRLCDLCNVHVRMGIHVM